MQAKLLRSFIDNLPPKSQLWIATHSIGMMREALKIEQSGTRVAFFDTSEFDFDSATTLTPVRPDRRYWKRILEVALDDMAFLVAPEILVLCEGDSGPDGFDAQCFRTIFRDRSNVEFVSVGDSRRVKAGGGGLSDAIGVLSKGTTVLSVVDGDDHTDNERAELRKQGVIALRRRSLETYLLSDEVLGLLCELASRPDLAAAAIEARDLALERSGHLPDDYKKSRQAVHQFARNVLQLANVGTTAETFLIERLAPLVTPGTSTYGELNQEIFGE